MPPRCPAGSWGCCRTLTGQELRYCCWGARSICACNCKRPLVNGALNATIQGLHSKYSHVQIAIRVAARLRAAPATMQALGQKHACMPRAERAQRPWRRAAPFSSGAAAPRRPALRVARPAAAGSAPDNVSDAARWVANWQQQQAAGGEAGAAAATAKAAAAAPANVQEAEAWVAKWTQQQQGQQGGAEADGAKRGVVGRWWASLSQSAQLNIIGAGFIFGMVSVALGFFAYARGCSLHSAAQLVRYSTRCHPPPSQAI